jgi:hypothetical protein
MDTMQGDLTRGKLDCPCCSRVLDAFTTVGHKHQPKAGDFSVCAYCGAILRFGPGCLMFLLATDDDLKLLTPENRKHLELAQEVARRCIRRGL